MPRSSLCSWRGRAASWKSLTGGGPWASVAGWIVAALGAVTLGSSCALDGRAFGEGGGSGAGGTAGSDGQGGTDVAPAGAGGSVAAGAGGGGGSATSSIGGSDGLGGVGGSAAGQGGSGTEPELPPDGGTVVEPEPELPFCAGQALAGLGSATAATTAGGEGQFSLSCAAGSSDDEGFFWIAPEAGYYSIDTFDSSFDTTLGVVSSNCAEELACNDDARGASSEIVREFAAGEAVVLVVDGKSGSFGDVVVNTHAVTCPGIDLNRQVPPVATTTLDGTNQHSGACGGDGQREKAFRWKARNAGLYRFTATTPDFTPALYLERGARCGGEPIGCNAGGFRSPATVVARLAEDEVVTLIVDGTDGAGNVQLNVEDVSSETCPNQPTFSPFDPVIGVLAGGDPSVLTGSCVPARQTVLPGATLDLPEHSYPMTIDGASCRVIITADGPVAIYIHQGLECGGGELFCETVDDPSDGALIDHDLGNLQGPAIDYVVTVEATNPNGSPVNYTLEFLCAQN